MVALLLSQWSVPVYSAQAVEAPLRPQNLSLVDIAPNVLLNQAPNVPGNPTPTAGATYVTTTTALSWSGGDPDDDPVTYVVAFGTYGAISVVDSNVTATTYDPGLLDYNRTYYWQIRPFQDSKPSKLDAIYSGSGRFNFLGQPYCHGWFEHYRWSPVVFLDAKQPGDMHALHQHRYAYAAGGRWDHDLDADGGR